MKFHELKIGDRFRIADSKETLTKTSGISRTGDDGALFNSRDDAGGQYLCGWWLKVEPITEKAVAE